MCTAVNQNKNDAPHRSSPYLPTPRGLGRNLNCQKAEKSGIASIFCLPDPPSATHQTALKHTPLWQCFGGVGSVPEVLVGAQGSCHGDADLGSKSKTVDNRLYAKKSNMNSGPNAILPEVGALLSAFVVPRVYVRDLIKSSPSM